MNLDVGFIVQLHHGPAKGVARHGGVRADPEDIRVQRLKDGDRGRSQTRGQLVHDLQRTTGKLPAGPAAEAQAAAAQTKDVAEDVADGCVKNTVLFSAST